jgi:ethanolamine utilization protein EutQ (cupin superfamily)
MQAYVLPQASLINMQGLHQAQLQNMSGEFDKTMQSIAALAPVIQNAAIQGHNGYSLMKDKSNPELTDAQKIMMIIAQSMPVVADGAQKGSDVYNIWKQKQAAIAAHPEIAALQNLNGEFDKTMLSIAALAPILQEAAQQGHAGYALMKDKSNPELTDAQKIMMIIANSMPVVADGAQKGSDVYNIWKK